MKKFNDIVIKGVGGETIILDVTLPLILVEDKEDKGRTFINVGGHGYRVPYALVQIDAVIREARGLGLRPGVERVKPVEEKQNRHQRRAVSRALKVKRK